MADLTTWATVQTRLNLDASQQAETERYITVASVRAEQYTRRTLAAVDDTFLLDGTGRVALDLGQWPVNSVTSVHVDNTRAFTPDTEVTDYIIRSDIGHLVGATSWPRGIANVRVVANVGYTSVPADLEESVIQLVGYWLDSPQVSWLTPQAGGDTASMSTNYVGVMDLPFQVRSIWDHYKRMVT